MAAIFPTHLFNPLSITPIEGRRVISGGVALNNVEDVIETDGGGIWGWQFAGIELRTPQLQKAWNAWKTYAEAGAQEFWLFVPSISIAPRAAFPGASKAQYDDLFFPSELAYAQPVVIAALTEPAALRSTQVSIIIHQGSRLQGGERFSIAHEDGPGLYSIGRVLSSAGQQATVQIWPPLRDAVVLGEAANFDFPMMRAKLQPGYDMSAEIIAGRYGTGQAIFVEATV